MFRLSRLFRWRTEKINVPAFYKPRREPLLTPTLVLIGTIPVLTFGLGIWQLRRLKWKVNLIDELQEKLEIAPLPLPKRINLDVIPEFAFRKVIIKGVWDHAHSMVVAPRVREGVHGAHVITPLLREDGTTVLVDRGFITKQVAESLSYQKPEGTVQILGLLRNNPGRNMFTPTNHPDEGQWYWSDIVSMAQFAGGERANVQPVFVEQVFDSHAGDAALRLEKGIPVGRSATVDLRNAHLSYVITWFGLSAMTSFMFIRMLVNKKKQVGRRLPRV